MADLLGDDPAAEFLQQEEDQLRELGIDENQFIDSVKDDDTNFMDDLQNGPTVPQDDFDTSGSTPIIPVMQTPVEEPESLKKWREEKAASLSKQEEEENEASQSWRDKAKKELEDWYNRYNEQLEKVSNENKAAQQQFIEEMTDTKPGNEWEKTARFCDFNPKFSKNTKDVSRMRGLLLHLKQSPLVR